MLEQKIKDIQTWAGTKADGIIGDKTIIALWSKIHDLESPKAVAPAELIRKEMAKKILNMEDYKITGPESLRVTSLPSGDGGGQWEIAGICDGIEPNEFRKIKGLLDTGKRDEAWEECLRYVLQNTEPLLTHGVAGGYAIEFMLRDMTFNMGVAGTTKVVQRMLGTSIDGKWGPNTQKKWTDKLASATELSVVDQLDSACRNRYKSIADNNPVKKKFLVGWMNRCTNRYGYAITLL